ncbi:MAG: adenine phosphoribosyltransferase [Actinomycetales bacterium mxb001]|nr:MAG: adenine phosphoribosyltransferase [Actinomycetales bacterium mxb001]
MPEDLSPLWGEVVVIPDFPTPGISFKDISGILANPVTFGIAVRAWADAVRPEAPTKVVGIEARGFPIGAALAYELGCGFVSLRKEGKLPRDVHRREYVLEYGTSILEIHQDDLAASDRVVIVDDVLATGGTASAAVDLVRESGASVISVALIMDLPFLQGRAVLEQKDVRVHVLFDDEGTPYPHP